MWYRMEDLNILKIKNGLLFPVGELHGVPHCLSKIFFPSYLVLSISTSHLGVLLRVQSIIFQSMCGKAAMVDKYGACNRGGTRVQRGQPRVTKCFAIMRIEHVPIRLYSGVVNHGKVIEPIAKAMS